MVIYKKVNRKGRLDDELPPVKLTGGSSFYELICFAVSY